VDKARSVADNTKSVSINANLAEFISLEHSAKKLESLRMRKQRAFFQAVNLICRKFNLWKKATIQRRAESLGKPACAAAPSR
jgi:hypothetical protein